MEGTGREYFMRTERLGFGKWDPVADRPLAHALWGDRDVMALLARGGVLSAEEVDARLAREVANEREHGMSYWPLFLLESGDFVGCCGLKPGQDGRLELGYQLRRCYWGRGLAKEASYAAIRRAFDTLGAQALQGVHHPHNTASGNVLRAFGFVRAGTQFYPPTGLMHYFYTLDKSALVVPPRLQQQQQQKQQQL